MKRAFVAMLAVAALPLVASAQAAGGRGGAAAQQAGRGGRAPAVTPDTAPPGPVIILREVYQYPRGERRDPFVSLLTTEDLRPTLTDLRLTGVLYDHTGQQPVASLRDNATNLLHNVTVGAILGRMRVTAIRPGVVVFTIEEFGLNRRDSLMLRDSTQARSK